MWLKWAPCNSVCLVACLHFNVLTIVDDTMAGGIYYLYDQIEKKGKISDCKFLILHQGSSYTELALFEVKDGIIKVLEKNGLRLGGEDIDNSLIQHCRNECLKIKGIDLKIFIKKEENILCYGILFAVVLDIIYSYHLIFISSSCMQIRYLMFNIFAILDSNQQ